MFRAVILIGLLALLDHGNFVLLGQDSSRLTFHQAPKPLAKEATVADWHRFLGPNDDCTTPETHLIDGFEKDGPKLVWEMTKGSGYTTPVIAQNKLIMFDRYADEEVIECFHPESGKPIWKYSYPVTYRDRYGFNNGPRASAVIAEERVYTLGVTSMLTCVALDTGKLIWQKDLDKEYDVADYFFGHGSCPIVFDNKVIVNLGGRKDQVCVVAFNAETGKQEWTTKHEWLASYSSPVVKTLQGKPRLLVFAGGESRPPFGGLMCIDPTTGELHDTFFWRADKYESVNSSSPIVVGNNRVFISECYEIGGAMLELTPELKWKKLWDAPGFNLHWMTPVHENGELFGFLGRNEPDAYLGSFNIETGQENWKKDIIWSTTVGGREGYQLSYFRGSILRADAKYFALGELGTLAMMKLDKQGFEETSRSQLFVARATWSPPVIHKGLLYISQHETEFPFIDNPKPARLLCYDLRR